MMLARAVSCLLLLTVLIRSASAAVPSGSLDAADEGILAGWARDDDFTGPIQVEIYVDGNLVITGLANLVRPDVGAHAFHFRPNTFGPGSHTAHAYALGVNASGQPDGDRVELSNSPKTWIGASAPPVMQVDGQPFFMTGWYTSAGSPSVAESEQYLGTMRRQGMNTALICYGIWLDNNSMINRMQGAMASDMKIMVEIHRWALQGLEGYPLSLIDDQVDLLKDYPSMLAWYLIDEPELQGVTPAMAQDRYGQIKARDPAHPITVAHVGYNSAYPETYLAAEPPPYCDVEMTDTYPITDGAAEFAAQLWLVATESRHRTAQTSTHGKEAYINIVQTHGDFGLRIPTYIETRYLSYAPIVQGARGLLYWMHNAYTTPGHRDIVVPSVAHEIQSLAPAIMSNSNAVWVSSDHDSDPFGRNINQVSYLFCADERCGYLIATNNLPNSYAVQFQLVGNVLSSTLGSGQATVPVMFEERSVTAQPTGTPTVWTLTDSFGPFAVHVYRLYELAAPPAASIPPGQVSNPHPEHAAIAVGRTFDLRWTPAANATSYQVYFGTVNPPPLQGSQDSTIFDPGQMSFDTTYYWRVDAVNDEGVTPGDVWSFATLPPNLPTKAANPVPAHSAMNVATNTSLSWKWGGSARSYNVHFGTANPPPFVTNQPGFGYIPGPLQHCTTYYWRIDPVNDDGTTTGDVWSFTTQSALPAQASNPNPQHQATGVVRDVNLSWASANAVTYNIYFGTSSPPPFQVTQTETSFTPGLLAPHTTYYWRIDAVNACATTTGNVWSFVTRSVPGDFDADDDVDLVDFGHMQVCFSGDAVTSPPGCVEADLDGDGDVDPQDFNAFLPCLAGANRAPGC